MKHLKPFTISVLLCVLFGFGMSAQNYVPFPASDAEWNEVLYHGQPISQTNYTYTMQGDTVIEDMVYQNIYYQDTVLPTDELYYAASIRQDTLAKKVHARNYEFLPDNEEVLLYDFSKSIGDTVVVGVEDISLGYYIIDHIDSILTGNMYRKTFYFTGIFSDYYWIEGIGSTGGLFAPVRPIPTGPHWWYNTCFWHDGELQFMNPEFNNCFPILTSVDEDAAKPQSNSLTASPNPTHTGGILLDIKDLECFPNAELKVFDIYGKTIHHETVAPHQSATRLDTSRWPAGIYIAAIFSNGQIKDKCKLVVE
ncbi:MAG TPA: T9SS type A sorting domain-containing protein [Bacteroidales bacterium]|nr:T9SS type A sorting domain-containing protein [Bacteroidales bacterium]